MTMEDHKGPPWLALAGICAGTIIACFGLYSGDKDAVAAGAGIACFALLFG